jgi:octaheme c-type cytochrome (tetrathionate reductase family)
MKTSTRLFAGAACVLSLLLPVWGHATDKSAPAAPADHSTFAVLQQKFDSGPAVTRACLTCHTQAAKEVQKTEHWRWEYVNPDTGQMLGKRHVVNNFCTSAVSNFDSCATCHVGYGMKQGFDFTAEQNVDCLVCHDTTGKYRKQPGLAGNVVTKDTELPPGSGHIVKAIDLASIAQRVGKTSRVTCGNCHFNGGGGDGVKHGDLDSSLESPEKTLDVHMNADGLNFSCATCHRTSGHQVPGSRYAPTAQDKGDAQIRGERGTRNPATCQSCHGQAPHKRDFASALNGHTGRIACQTCHVPEFARGGIPTKMDWDWSTAGKRAANGKPLEVKNDEGHLVYTGIKGNFVYGENVVPEYIWFNGRVKYTLPGAKLDDQHGPVAINRFEGSPDDPKSMIWPVKLFRGKQAYDPVTKSLAVTHLAGEDDTAYWTNLNWEKAVGAGMAAAGLPFSGKVGFIETYSMWPITHMVAPASGALKCAQCHASGGRLEKVGGIYMPGRGRDHLPWLELAGWALAALTLAAVLAHGLLRFATRRSH